MTTLTPDASRSPATTQPPIATRGLLLAVVIFALAVRAITAPEIDVGGDATIKWYNGKILLGVAMGDWEWTHHTARFGVMLPMLLVQAAGGTDPIFYYLPTFAVAALEAALLFLIGARLASPAFGFWVAIALVLHPQMVISGAQLLPGVYSAAYLLACTWCLLCYRDARGGPGWLMLAALSLFLAYLSKLSSLFFFPGVALALWSWRSSLRDVACFWGALAVLFALEIGAYQIFTEYAFGRISIVNTTDLPMDPLNGWLALFERYAVLPWSWTSVLGSYAIAAVGLWLAASRGRLDDRTVGILWLPASFLVGFTFAVRSVDPIIPAQVFNARYLTAGLPFFILTIGLFARFGLSLLPLPPLPPRRAAGAAAIVAVLLGWQLLAHFPGVAEHPFAKLSAARAGVADFVRGMPVVSSDRRGRGVRAWLHLFWNESAPEIRVARFGPDGTKGFWYTLHDQSAVTPEQLETLRYPGEAILIDSRQVPDTDHFGLELRRVRIGRDDRPPP